MKRMVWILKPSIRLVLHHNAAGVCSDGGEQGGDDGDDNLTDALQGFLGTFFYSSYPMQGFCRNVKQSVFF